jgi:uncharacterized membrane protein
MLRYAVTYITTLIIFGLMDGAFIATVVAPMYKKTLGPIMLEQFRTAPAMAFYLLYIAGIMIFVVPPAPGGQSIWQTALFGGLFGLLTYATLDLTALAIIERWTLNLALSDIAWGITVTAVGSALGVLGAEAILRRIG